MKDEFEKSQDWDILNRHTVAHTVNAEDFTNRHCSINHMEDEAKRAFFIPCLTLLFGKPEASC